MNITCIHCGDDFSISADQLGTRGKCPHCKATVIMPKSEKNRPNVHELTPPSRWMENSLCGIGAVILHLLVLIGLALVPWGQLSDGAQGSADQVLIGQLPRNQLVDNPDDDFKQVEVNSSTSDSQTEMLDSEMFSPTATSELTETMLDLSSMSPSGGTQQPFEIESFHDSAIVGGGQEDFGEMLTRLKRDGLDIVITFDSTGSMQGEIDQVKGQIERIGSVLYQLVPKTRISICTYRDESDLYVVKGLPLTDSLDEVVEYLADIQAGGGGDEPEAVNYGLKWSIEKNRFRRRARKIIMVFGDAPPHASRMDECLLLASNFRKRQSGNVSTVTCRKSKRLEEFAEISQLGGGESFLTRDEREIMSKLIVLIFGSQHQGKVLEAFDLLDR
jgi:Mg-chelatase subunit ChlD/DNA-directed RNA polymerase subunit RPC12/RpoP